VYVTETEKRVVIAYRGTDLRDFSDLMSDVQVVLGLNGIDPRVLRSLEVYDAVRMQYPYYQIRVCGHSLGGTLSYLVAKHRNPDRCIVFNPGAAPNSVFV
jgi:alpha-beta hydrolase superfamily lysophospholipase